MYGYIYLITNNITNKQYVGKHKYSKPELDESYITSGTLINKSIEKYGLENFTRELVDIADSYEDLNNLEKYYIRFYNCRVPNGYNLTSGGDGVVDPDEQTRLKMAFWTGKTSSRSSNQKRSETLKKVVHTKEWVDKIRLANTGKTPSDLCIQRNKELKTGSCWYNNGVEEHMFQLCNVPEGYIKGRLKNPFPDQKGRVVSELSIEKFRQKVVGRCWYNNGEREIMRKDSEEIPEGFTKGRLKAKKS